MTRQATSKRRPDDELAPEVPTSFATKGVGWSGREDDDMNVVDLNEESD